jgi:HAD superfamily hydrolase (TIGR01549 family)
MNAQGNLTYPGIIFDLDGTLIESTIDFNLMRSRVIRYLAELVSDVLLEGSDTIANNVERARKDLERREGSAFVKTMEQHVEGICNEVEMKDVEASKEIPGARKVLQYLTANGHKVGILTRGSREYAEKALQVAGLDHMYDAMVCRDDHAPIEAKPHPEALRRAAIALGLPTESCIFVGDHLMDLECARSAGSEFIAVLSGHQGREGWEAHGVGVVLSSVEGIPELLERRERSRPG